MRDQLGQVVDGAGPDGDDEIGDWLGRREQALGGLDVALRPPLEDDRLHGEARRQRALDAGAHRRRGVDVRDDEHAPTRAERGDQLGLGAVEAVRDDERPRLRAQPRAALGIGVLAREQERERVARRRRLSGRHRGRLEAANATSRAPARTSRRTPPSRP
jgi:hypothetical protein